MSLTIDGSAVELGRREFLKQSVLVLAGISAGTLTLQGCSSPGPASSGSAIGQPGAGRGTSMPNEVVSFGWEATNIDNNGANVYFMVNRNMVLNSIDIDVSFMVTALSSPGFAEVLCQGCVSRQKMPVFGTSRASYMQPAQTSDFGSVALTNPNNLGMAYDVNLSQDLFYSVILKSFVPDNGAASSASRHVHAQPALSISAGDYLVFHMDHAGVPCDTEMQVVLAYST